MTLRAPKVAPCVHCREQAARLCWRCAEVKPNGAPANPDAEFERMTLRELLEEEQALQRIPLNQRETAATERQRALHAYLQRVGISVVSRAREAA